MHRHIACLYSCARARYFTILVNKSHSIFYKYKCVFLISKLDSLSILRLSKRINSRHRHDTYYLSFPSSSYCQTWWSMDLFQSPYHDQDYIVQPGKSSHGNGPSSNMESKCRDFHEYLVLERHLRLLPSCETHRP